MKTATAMKAPKPSDEAVKALGECTLGVLGVLYVIGLLLVRSWCLTKLWAWFVVPLGVIPVGILGAIGLTVTASVMLGLDRLEAKQSAWRNLWLTLLTTVVAWGIHLFM
jgi:hypothetical protein